jgi:TRAP transporter TAXI family solute receptor
MKLQKAIVVSAALLLISALFAGCQKKEAAPAASAPAAPARIRLATGGNTGTYYAYGSAVGQIAGQKIGIPIVVSSTGASKANIQLIAANEADLAIVQNDVMDYAYKGVDLFNGEKIDGFYAVGALYAEACQVVATQNIRSIADLKGKNVSVGDAGSGTEFNAWQILEAYGITINDINKQNLSFGASADALRDGKIDAFFCVAGAPTTAIMDLSTNKDVVLLEIDDPHAAQIIAKYPFYTKLIVPGGSYRGNPNDVQTLTVKATLIAKKDLPEDVIYNFTKSLFSNKAEIQAAHAKGAEIDPGYAVAGISVPFHPGAERYFKEIGALK